MFQGYPVFIYYPYELAYLSSLLKRELPGDQVKMVDGTWLRFTADDYVRFLKHEKPDWVVFEVDTVTYGETRKIADRIKSDLGTRVIMTGQYPTAFPEKVAADGYRYVCIGEFEATVLDVLKGKEPKSIEGLHPNSYRKVLDMDWLPDPEDEDIRRIDYSYSGGHRWTRYREIEVHPSRGCPYTCDFCVAGTVYYENINWRFRKPERIIHEIETLRRKYPQMEGCFFNEETHIIQKKTILAFCDALIASGNNDLHFEAMANHQRLDEEILEALKRAGYYKLRIGIESVDEATGQSIGLVKTRPDRLEKVLKIAHKLGIEMYGTFLFGASGSTREGDRKTIEFGRRVISRGLLTSWQASIAVPHPATPFYRKAVENGWLVTDNLDRFNGISDTVVSYPDYPRQQILDTVKEMGREFEAAQSFDTVRRHKSVAQEKTALLKKDEAAVNRKLDALIPLFESGENAKTLEAAASILKTFPQALTARHVIGSVYKRMGNLAAARREFEFIIATAFDYEDALQYAAGAHFHLGAIGLAENKIEEARQHFKNCMHLNPDHEEARRHYWMLTETGGRRLGLERLLFFCKPEEKFHSAMMALFSLCAPLFRVWLRPRAAKPARQGKPLEFETLHYTACRGTPDVSVVIRTYNEAALLAQTLDAVTQQEGIKKEIIVIDSQSTDATVDIARSFSARIVEIKKSAFNYAAALNLGVRLARGKYIVNLSAHAVPADTEWLKNLIQPLAEDPGTAGVHGRELPMENRCSGFEWKILTDSFPDCRIERENDFFFSNANSAMRRETLVDYPFDDSVGWAEDQLWADRMQKAGYKTVYQPSAAVYHSHNLTAKQNFRRCLKYHQTLFATVYRGRAAEVCDAFRASLAARAVSLRRFLVERQLMRPLPAFFYAPFCEYVNYLGCEISSRAGTVPKKVAGLGKSPVRQPQNQAVS